MYERMDLDALLGDLGQPPVYIYYKEKKERQNQNQRPKTEALNHRAGFGLG